MKAELQATHRSTGGDETRDPVQQLLTVRRAEGGIVQPCVASRSPLTPLPAIPPQVCGVESAEDAVRKFEEQEGTRSRLDDEKAAAEKRLEKVHSMLKGKEKQLDRLREEAAHSTAHSSADALERAIARAQQEKRSVREKVSHLDVRAPPLPLVGSDAPPFCSENGS